MTEMKVPQEISMTFKIVLLGESNVGKTSILQSFTDETFTETQPPTIGLAFSKKVIERKNMRITLEIWDTAGQEKFKKIAPIYYRNAQAVLIVYDVTRQESFKDAIRWLEEVDRFLSQDCIKYLVGNKVDLGNGLIPKLEIESFIKQNNMSYIDTSAKNGYNIQRLFRRVARSLAKNKLRKIESMDQKQIIKLQIETDDQQKEISRTRFQACCHIQ